MRPGGLVIVIAGIWLGCQVFGGDALERLGILSKTSGATAGTAPSALLGPAVTPAPSSNVPIWT